MALVLPPRLVRRPHGGHRELGGPIVFRPGQPDPGQGRMGGFPTMGQYPGGHPPQARNPTLASLLSMRGRRQDLRGGLNAEQFQHMQNGQAPGGFHGDFAGMNPAFLQRIAGLMSANPNAGQQGQMDYNFTPPPHPGMGGRAVGQMMPGMGGGYPTRHPNQGLHLGQIASQLRPPLRMPSGFTGRGRLGYEQGRGGKPLGF